MEKGTVPFSMLFWRLPIPQQTAGSATTLDDAANNKTAVKEQDRFCGPALY